MRPSKLPIRYASLAGFAMLVACVPAAQQEAGAPLPAVEADSRIIARFVAEPSDAGVGEPITLRVRLSEDGMPVTTAVASVRVVRPGEGLGNILSTVGEDCSVVEPTPAEARAGADLLSQRLALSMAEVRLPIRPADRRLLAEAIFLRCRNVGLDTEGPEIVLRDDGSGGDATAGDGEYAGRFTGTDVEGSYRFRFAVNATGPATGATFTETRAASVFVRVRPDPAASLCAGRRTIDADGSAASVLYFMPRDRFGNMLGPGFASEFRVDTKDGELVKPVRDIGNGYYAVELRHSDAARTAFPAVSLPDLGFAVTLPGTDDNDEGDEVEARECAWPQ